MTEMMKQFIQLFMLATVVLAQGALAFAASPAVSNSPEPTPDYRLLGHRGVTLQEAISLAMKDNPEIKAVLRSVEAERFSVASARSHLLPHLRFEERFMRTNNPMYAFGSKLNQSSITASDFNPKLLNEPEDMDDYQSSVTVEQAIFAPKAYLGLKMAKTQASAAEYGLLRKREAVTLDVIKAYMNIITARNYLEVVQKGQEDAREHHRIAVARNKAGLGLYSDTLRTEVALRLAEEQMLRANKGMQLSMHALSLLIGLDEPVYAVESELNLNVLTYDEYLALSRERTDLLSMSKRVENASNSIKLAGSAYLPVLGVGGSWQANSEEDAFGSDGEGYTVMAFLRWDLYDGGQRRSERQKAIARKHEAESYLDGLRKSIAFSVRKAYLEMEEAEGSLELAEARLALAQESQRLISSRYENSLTTVVELMDAQSSLNAARAGVVEKINNYSVAIAELMFQSGVILGGYAERENQGGE